MGFWDRLRGKEVKADWEKITQKNISKWYDELDDQKAEQVFQQLQEIIANNNQKKALVKATVAILKAAADVGIKVAKG